MLSRSSSRPPGWDALDQAYVDEFGAIEPDVYETARELWPQAQSFGARLLAENDAARLRTLMLKAAAQSRDVALRRRAER